MDQRTVFLIQVLEKIGTPLAAAVTSLPGASGPDNLRQDAQRVAELLNRSVQLGLSVADSMNVRDAAQADGVHLSLAAFASPLVAGSYMATGRIPNDTEIRRLSSSLQAVLTFADNFTPAADLSLRLENMNPGDAPADEALVHVQMLQAFSPVLQAISEYSFGKPENKLLQDVSTRLMIRAEDLRKDLFGQSLGPKEARQADMVLLSLAGGLYASCHRAETLRLTGLDDKTRAATTISLDSVWSAFDKRLEMVRVLAEQIIPPEKDRAGTGAGTASGPMPKIFRKQEINKNPPPPRQGMEGQKPDSANPMAFFATGKKATDRSSV